MSNLFTRTAVVPIWLLVCVFAVVSSSPSGTVAIPPLVFASGLAALAILLLRRNAAPAPVSHAPVNSWPDSGFRNIGRGTKGG
jgi:hypothetical protein